MTVAASELLALQAQVEAFALTSPVAFKLGLVALGHSRVGVMDGSTQQLSDALDERMRSRVDGMSLEGLNQLRNLAWFAGAQERVSLHAHVMRLAHSCLRVCGGRAELRDDEERGEATLRWRWLSLALPADLMVSALGASRRQALQEDEVDLLTPGLREVLREPCAETHLHVGAAMSYSVLWTGLSRAIADSDQPMRFRPTRDLKLPFGGSEGLMKSLLAAMIVRILMASMLRWREQRGAGTMEEFCSPPRGKTPGSTPEPKEDERPPESPLEQVGGTLEWPWGEQDVVALLRGTIMALLHDRALPEIRLLRMLYQRLMGWKGKSPPAKDTASLVALDPLRSCYPRFSGRALPEIRFATHALSYLDELAASGDSDTLFERCFWQYERVRCQVFHMLIQEPGTAGLDWFTQFYYRISPFRDALESIKYHSALVTQGRGINLGALEARTAPARRWTEVRDEVRAMARQALALVPEPRQGPEIGLVLHFIKSWRDGRGHPHASPSNKSFGCRHGAWFHEQWLCARAVTRALDFHPELLLVLRGIDIANVELAQPAWVVALLLKKVRRASEQAAAQVRFWKPEWQVSPLRITHHAGEDYRRLIEGLRNVHEAIEFGTLRLGDRLGHALVVGEDAEQWGQAHRQTVQPAEERLDDLLWELDRYTLGEIPHEGRRRLMVEDAAQRLGRQIYGDDGGDVSTLRQARRLRFDEELLTAWNYPFLQPDEHTRGSSPGDQMARRLLVRYLTDAGVYERGQAPLCVEATEDEMQVTRNAQNHVRRLLGRMEITIETNPSSNLLIGALSSPEEHPIFRLSPLPGRPRGEEAPVMLSVNTDNPVTFASCLGDEFAHTYHALLRQGIGSDESLTWLERVRQAGFRSRFTLAASRSAQALRLLIPQ